MIIIIYTMEMKMANLNDNDDIIGCNDVVNDVSPALIIILTVKCFSL